VPGPYRANELARLTRLPLRRRARRSERFDPNRCTNAPRGDASLAGDLGERELAGPSRVIARYAAAKTSSSLTFRGRGLHTLDRF